MKGKMRLLRWFSRLALPVLLVLLLVLPASAADWDGAMKAIAAGTKQEVANIDIERYGIPKEEFWDQYNEWVDQGKFPWYVRNGGNGRYNTKTGMMTQVMPNYLDRTKYSRTKYEQAVQKILSEAIDDDMSQWQRALALHDYLVTHCEYDHRYEGSSTLLNRQSYDAIVDGLAVCAGYARAYMDLMNRVGIPTVYVSSEPMNHAWNLVKISGKWYHVDATWDDPSFFDQYDVKGYCTHKYFLMSDSTMSDSEHRHYGWTPYYTCDSTTFEGDTFWSGLESAVILPHMEYSFLRRGDYKTVEIRRRDSLSIEETILYRGDNPGWGSKRSTSYGISYDNGYIYFCDNQNVYAVSPAGGDAVVVYTNPNSNSCLQGCFVGGGVMKLTLRDGSNRVWQEQVKAPIPNNHKHSYQEVEYASTCQTGGYSLYSCVCGSRFTAAVKETVEHDMTDVRITKQPTCTADGERTVSCAYGCGANWTERIPATGEHTYEPGYKVTVEPDFGITGRKVRTCTGCKGQFEEKLQDLDDVRGEFWDVSGGKFYYEPVLWAFSRGVTTGTQDGVFSPDMTCTRGQVVTFLWRAMGEPEPVGGKNPFTDVKEGTFYYKAVLWAVENGITNGMTATTFEPGGSCTRGQVVTFLNRTAGKPTAGSDRCEFQDVQEGAYYYSSMLWALENSITNGITSTTFEPNQPCSRGQIVTFLHRYLNN